MNPNICDKCHKHHWYYKVVFLKGYKEVILMSVNRTNKIVHCTEDDVINDPCELTSNDKSLIDVCSDYILKFNDDLMLFPVLMMYEDIQPLKETCPFYLEHQLYDWNKKHGHKDMSTL